MVSTSVVKSVPISLTKVLVTLVTDVTIQAKVAPGTFEVNVMLGESPLHIVSLLAEVITGSGSTVIVTVWMAPTQFRARGPVGVQS